MKTFKLSTTIALIIVMSFAACKKNKDVVKKPDCRIITATPTPSSAGDPFNISYNNDGKVSTLSIGSDITTFAYSGNTAIATTNSSGTFQSKKIITFNANGLATNVKTEHNVSGTDWDNQAFEYNGTEIIKATTTYSSGGAPSITMMTWSNNNLASATSGSSTTTLDYYTDKPAQTGDYLYLAQLVAGYQIYKTKNLLKSILYGSSINNFSYTFDGDGKITSVVVTGASTATYTYQHQCN